MKLLDSDYALVFFKDSLCGIPRLLERNNQRLDLFVQFLN